MVGARISGILNAHALQVGGSLVLRSGAKARQAVYGSVGSGTAVDLTSAKVVGNVDMDGVIVNGPFDAADLQVGESLLMRTALPASMQRSRRGSIQSSMGASSTPARSN